MKEIRTFEEAIEQNARSLKELGINGTLFWAYRTSKETGNELIDFNEVIWDYDIDPILENCRRFGIEAFTISSTFSSLILTIAELQKRGCKLDGLVEINSRYDDWRAGLDGSERRKERIPAFKMSL